MPLPTENVSSLPEWKSLLRKIFKGFEKGEFTREEVLLFMNMTSAIELNSIMEKYFSEKERDNG